MKNSLCILHTINVSSSHHTSRVNAHSLEDYILMPWGQGVINRIDCIFISHFWTSQTEPNLNGQYLRLLQRDLSQAEWSFVWVDWTCAPQAPRNSLEAKYFARLLETVSYLIRQCSFMYYYPPFQPKLWILYEVAECTFTCLQGMPSTPDAQKFLEHMNEIIKFGVRLVLDKYGYRCTRPQDTLFLTARLELLVIVETLGLDIMTKRWVLDNLTWQPSMNIHLILNNGITLSVNLKEGNLQYGQAEYEFTPFRDLVVAAESG